MEEEERLAFEDPLTGLPNWNILGQFVEHSCSLSQRYQRSSALLRLDLDQLSLINRELGRSGGDEVLVQAAARLQALVRSSDIVGRIGGDQFLVILTELSNDRGGSPIPVSQRASLVAARLNQAFRQPFVVEGRPVLCSLSLGVALCPEDALLSQDWLEAAELALQKSKESGDCHVLYAEGLKQQVLLKRERQRQLEVALEQQRLEFRWLELQGPQGSQAAQHYWWNWPQGQVCGPQIRDWIDSAGLQAAWSNWQRQYLTEKPLEPALRLLPLPPAWLNPGYDSSELLLPQRLWEVEEATLQHRLRLRRLLELQEQGMNWVLGCSGRGLQNLGSLGRLQPTWIKLPLAPIPSREVLRLLKASVQVARALNIQVLLTYPGQQLHPDYAELNPDWLLLHP